MLLAYAIEILTADTNGKGSDEIVADLGASGTWERHDSGAWTKITGLGNWQDAVVGDLDGDGAQDTIFDFGSAGLWARYNCTAWTRLHPTSPVRIATGDFDGNGLSWLKLHNASPTKSVTADLDRNGKAELIVDFGSNGLWGRFNDTTWTKLHTLPTQDIAAGSFD
jgi:hypothetical protein